MNNLKTERLVLRIVNINDTETIYNEILANKETLHFLDWPYCNNIEEAYGFMKDVINKLLWADITIWSFPLYYFNIPSKLKNTPIVTINNAK